MEQPSFSVVVVVLAPAEPVTVEPPPPVVRDPALPVIGEPPMPVVEDPALPGEFPPCAGLEPPLPPGRGLRSAQANEEKAREAVKTIGVTSKERFIKTFFRQESLRRKSTEFIVVPRGYLEYFFVQSLKH